MTIDALRCFLVLIQTRSFRGAAERTHRSQPAVSHLIKALERELGHTMVDRKTCEPTPAGQRLYARAQSILADADSIVHELRDFDELTARELRLGTSDTTALYTLPPIIRQFRDRFPQTRLTIVNRHSDAIAELVHQGELELGIVTLPIGRTDLESAELFRQRLVLVAPRRHVLSKRHGEIAFEELRNEPFVLLDKSTKTGALVERHFKRAGFLPRAVVDSGSFEIIKRYVAEGVGLALIPDAALSGIDKRLAQLNCPDLPAVSIGVVRRKKSYRTQAEEGLLKLIRGGD